MIFALSNQPGLAVSDDPGVDLPLRHVAHVVVYAVLTVLAGWALTGSRAISGRIIVVSGLLAMLYGVTDEWHQTFVPSRTGRPEDLIWDGIGVLIGAAVLWLTARSIDGDTTGAV
ncbi:MAG: VanZ family protein [Chloroflexi bacterium]|nr:VanZ family protein [Chloroflexota bacterium]